MVTRPFVRGQETWRAVRYLHCAAENALHRSAYQEAVTHLIQGLALLQTLPETPERAHHEVPLQLTLAQTQHVIGGSGSPEVEQAYTRARILCEQFGDARYIEAEIWRLKGEFLLRQAIPETSRAEACLQYALTVARHQQAKWWELRAAVSLSRLWQQQGKRHQARQLLEGIYGWFTEGFATADLQEAKALLATLG